MKTVDKKRSVKAIAGAIELVVFLDV